MVTIHLVAHLALIDSAVIVVFAINIDEFGMTAGFLIPIPVIRVQVGAVGAVLIEANRHWWIAPFICRFLVDVAPLVLGAFDPWHKARQLWLAKFIKTVNLALAVSWLTQAQGLLAQRAVGLTGQDADIAC